MWPKIQPKEVASRMDPPKILWFEVLIDLCSMADTSMQGSGIHLENTKDCVHLEIDRKTSGSGKKNCHIFPISDAQLNIIGRQFDSVMYI